jgi:hypothetical protein
VMIVSPSYNMAHLNVKADRKRGRSEQTSRGSDRVMTSKAKLYRMIVLTVVLKKVEENLSDYHYVTKHSTR